MADIDVKNKSLNQSSETQVERQRQSGGSEVPPGAERYPYFSLNPVEFFLNPFSVMRRMSEEMDRHFGRFSGHITEGAGGWFPAIDVNVQNNQLRVHADLPGLKPEDVKVEVSENALIIRGERRFAQEHKQGQRYHSERRYGEFYRQIALPQGANTDQAKAQFSDGVLEVTVPLPEQASRRREIPIHAGEVVGTATKAATAGGSSTQK